MIQVVDRTFAVLEYIAKDPDGKNRLSDIAAATELNASTCARILKALTNLGYVIKNESRGGYSLGPKSYSLASKGVKGKNIVLAGKIFLAELAEKINESILLATLLHGKRTVLYEITAKRQIQAQNEAMRDTENPIKTATGRLMLAHLSESDRNRIIGDMKNFSSAWPMVKTKADLTKALDEICKQGYAIRDKESEVVGIAVPIRDNEVISASLGIYLPAFRFNKKRETELIQEMISTAKKIEKVLLKQK